MIAAWMLYCVGIGLAFVVAGRALEWALHFAGRQTRWAWCVALVGTLVVPVAAWVAPEAFSTMPIPAPPVVAEPAIVRTPFNPTAAFPAAPPAQAFGIGDLDDALAWVWALGSAGLICALIVAAVRLTALRRRWRVALVDGRSVFVSENTGPAVVGVLRPSIVVPTWALDLAASHRALMLAHEEEHVRVGDTRLLAWAAAALVAQPWNPALWWQVRRLRLAVEMDCDARVLRRAGRAPEYGELLLQVGRRRTHLAPGAPALGEPISFLEHRIRRMAAGVPRWRWLGVAAGALLAAGALVAACEVPRPVEQSSRREDAAIAQQVRDHVDSAMAAHLRPVVWENLKRFYPELLTEASGPPVDVWFGHDARLRVGQAARMSGSRAEVTSQRIQEVFRSFRPGNDAWSVVDRRALTGLVRDNVRVVMVHLGSLNGSRDLSAFAEHPEMLVLPWIRDGIKQHYGTLMAERVGPPVELWFVADPAKRVLRTLQRPGASSLRVGIDDIHAVFPDLGASQVQEWRVAVGRSLGGLVRDNVGVVWIQVRSGAAPRLYPVPADTAPRLVSAGRLVYPELLHQAGIRGRVIVEAMIDTSGHADPSSVRVTESPHPAFAQVAKQYILAAQFDPARVGGRRVPALVRVPLEFPSP